MNRKDFIRNTCKACLGMAVTPVVFGACRITKIAAGQLTTDGLLLDVNTFAAKEKGKYLSYVVVRNEALSFPIYVYRFGETEYTALWMQCTHQGTELNAAGDMLQCPAHGSEFSNRGKLTSGPAGEDLRSFPVTVINNQLFIDLRKK